MKTCPNIWGLLQQEHKAAGNIEGSLNTQDRVAEPTIVSHGITNEPDCSGAPPVLLFAALTLMLFTNFQ